MMSCSDLLALDHCWTWRADLVVLLADDARVEHARGRVERVHRG